MIRLVVSTKWPWVPWKVDTIEAQITISSGPSSSFFSHSLRSKFMAFSVSRNFINRRRWSGFVMPDASAS